jgi:hypothetical protein
MKKHAAAGRKTGGCFSGPIVYGLYSLFRGISQVAQGRQIEQMSHEAI